MGGPRGEGEGGGLLYREGWGGGSLRVYIPTFWPEGQETKGKKI